MFTFLYQQDKSQSPERNWVEVHPEYLKDGVLCAKENGCSIRIRDWTVYDYMLSKQMIGKTAPTSNRVVLDLADLLLYPELPSLEYSDQF